jgi:hypothetical protein
MGKHDDHNRVAIWTERQRMDTLLTEVPHFPMPTGYTIDHTGPRRTSTEPYGQYELFVPLSHRSQLGIRCNKELFAIWKPRPSRIAAWFVAAGVLTAEMVK